MQSIITLTRFYLRRSRRGVLGFLQWSRLDSLPPVATALSVLLLGVAIPLLMDVDDRPTDLSTPLAVRRLERFLEEVEPSEARISPTGRIVTVRPAFHWNPVPGAAGYRFRLYSGGRLVVGTDLVGAPRFMLPGPGRLEFGEGYLFMVMGHDGSGTALGAWRRAEFSIEEPGEELGALISSARARLEPGDRALVLAGHYAHRGMRHELATELERYLIAAPGGDHASLARKVLAHLGHR